MSRLSSMSRFDDSADRRDYPLCERCEDAFGFCGDDEKILCDKCRTEHEAEKREQQSEGMER